MKRLHVLAAGLCLAAAPLCAQQVKLNLDALAAKASNKVDISLNTQTLQFAARFLGDDDPDEVKVKKLISGIEGVYVRAYEFKRDNEWTPADLEGVRSQLKAPDWSRIIGVESAEEGGSAEVHVRYENKKVAGVAIVATSPRAFTVVNIVGPVDLDSLAELSGHFGVPKLSEKKGAAKKEE